MPMPTVKKNTKKRLASSQDGTKAKKAHISGRATKHGDEGAKKRKLPVTHPVKEMAEDDSDEEFDGVDSGVDGMEDNRVEDDMDVDVSNKTSKDASVAGESHKTHRLLQEQRKAAKPHSQLIANAKRVWSLAGQKNISSVERQKHIQHLMSIASGKVKDIVLKHDASRIIQTLVKYGRQRERDQIAGELKGHYRDLARGKYSKFLVTKLIRFCPAHRASILLEFQSHVVSLLLHREASSVIANAFELYANAYERSILTRDFYGTEAAFFFTSHRAAEDIETAKKGLHGLLDRIESDRCKRVLAALKENLMTVFNNPDKGAVIHAIVHRCLWEFLTAVDNIEVEQDQEKLRREIFESCQDVLAEMVHTKDGSRAVRNFIAHGTAKDRKRIVQVIKPHVERMCMDDEAQLVLFTALDIIDDTKLTVKSLVSDMTLHILSLAASPQGRRSLFHLIVPRSRRHFTPAQIAMIAETDSMRAKTSKKDDTIRESEIRKAASPELVQFVEKNGAETARDTGGSLLVLDIMLYAEGDKSPAMTALAEALVSSYPSEDPSRPHPIDLPHTSRMYKSLLQGGHFSHSEKSIVCSPAFSPSEFASVFLSVVGKDTTIAIAQGDGAFVVAELLERVREAGDDEQTAKVKGWFDDAFVSRIKDCEAKGKNVLLEKIKALS